MADPFPEDHPDWAVKTATSEPYALPEKCGNPGYSLALQIIGVVICLFTFPFGLVIGLPLLIGGSILYRCGSWRCNACKTRIEKTASICPSCRTRIRHR